MYRTCLHCNRDLGTNEVLETLPIGRRIAFDAAHGRLWVVCRNCAKWNLVPFETRLESIDACERLYRDTAKRYSTGSIGLARARDGLDLVRIGPALRPEFAAWRYGESYRRRRRNAYIAGGLGVVIAGTAVATASAAIGAMAMVVGGSDLIQNAWRWGLRTNAGFRVADPDLETRVLRIGFTQLEVSRLVWEENQLALEVPRVPTLPSAFAPMQWRGADVFTVGRRVAGGLNLTAGTGRNIDRAVTLIAENGGELSHWLRRRGASGYFSSRSREAAPKPKPWGTWTPAQWLSLHELPPAERLGVEMWMNEDIERVWLAGELKLLEREWRQAEELAKIADELVVKGDG